MRNEAEQPTKSFVDDPSVSYVVKKHIIKKAPKSPEFLNIDLEDSDNEKEEPAVNKTPKSSVETKYWEEEPA